MAIIIAENLHPHVEKVVNISERIAIMHLGIQIQDETMDILDTHAPEMSTTSETRKEYRNDIELIRQ